MSESKYTSFGRRRIEDVCETTGKIEDDVEVEEHGDGRHLLGNDLNDWL